MCIPRLRRSSRACSWIRALQLRALRIPLLNSAVYCIYKVRYMRKSFVHSLISPIMVFLYTLRSSMLWCVQYMMRAAADFRRRKFHFPNGVFFGVSAYDCIYCPVDACSAPGPEMEDGVDRNGSPAKGLVFGLGDHEWSLPRPGGIYSLLSFDKSRTTKPRHHQRPSCHNIQSRATRLWLPYDKNLSRWSSSASRAPPRS